jgi:hypothetical protein
MAAVDRFEVGQQVVVDGEWARYDGAHEVTSEVAWVVFDAYDKRVAVDVSDLSTMEDVVAKLDVLMAEADGDEEEL